MGFQKGNKLGGRKVGSQNKINQPIRDSFLKLLENNIEKMHQDLDELEPKDRLKLLLDMASYCIPKLKAIELNDKLDNKPKELEITLNEARIIRKALEEKY